MTRAMISFGSRMEEDMSFSRAVIDGDLVFVSGTTGYDYESMTIKPDVAAQAEQAFLNIERALAQANATLDDTTHVTFIIPTRSDWPLCWPVIKKYLGRSKPASTMFHAGLYTDDMKIEIQVTARIANRFAESKLACCEQRKVLTASGSDIDLPTSSSGL